ncbi:hypothetical protein ACUH7Y_16010 [Clostridium beijerinckii]|uniref:Uncharacterized protein n=1 Tax=Clostridium beijerinckii TaxID=1520 RepID=A0A7X9SLB8_CLOBE|nr:hypothetical protein [Clostridium beijerinckii]NMF03703.1 hypothetical protein [Clostridium beijerinckii]
MDKLIKWINGRIERTSQLWYCWIGVVCGIEILNITLVRKYAPFWCDTVISILLLSMIVYYISVIYRYMYTKYKNYLETNQSEILSRLNSFEKYIKELSEEAKKDLDDKYAELSVRTSDYKSELKNEIDLQAKTTNANIEDKVKQLFENADKLAEDTNEAIANTNMTMSKAFEDSNNLVRFKSKELAELTTEKAEKAEQLILNKFIEQAQNNQDNLLILQNGIREVLDNDLNEFAKVQATVVETSDKINRSIDGHFESARSNSDEQQNKLNANISRMANDLSAELKVVSQEAINISNENSKEIINETCRVYNDTYNKEMELINNMFNKVNENNDVMIEQIQQTKNSIVENTDKEASEFNSKLIGIQDVINEKHFAIKNQIEEVSDKVIESTNSVMNSNHENLSEQIKEVTESVAAQLNKGKIDLVEKVVENKDKLAEILQGVLTRTISKLNEQAEVMANSIEVNNKHLEEASNKIVNNTNIVVSSNQEKLSEQLKEITESVVAQLNKGKIDLIEKVLENKDKLAEILQDVLTQTTSKLNEQAEVMTNSIDVNQKCLEEVSNKIVNNTNIAVSSYQEKLSDQIKEVAESITTQISKDKGAIIESTKEGNNSLIEVINNAFTQAETRINENTAIVAEKLEITKDTINSLIALKQSEVLTKLENLNKESVNNLKAILDITNGSVQTGIKELAHKIDDSSNVVSNIIIDEISTVNSEQIEISKLIDNLIEKEKERQSVVEQAMDQFQSQLELLQKETIDEIVKSINGFRQSIIVNRDEENKILNDKFNNTYQHITKLYENLSNRTDKLDTSVTETVSIVKAIEESGTKKDDRLFDMLHQVLEKDTELALTARGIGIKQEETSSKIRNLETQMLVLNDLVKIFKKVISQQESYKNEAAITKQDPNRKEKIYDAESGITVLNTFNNDVLQYSEMQQLGMKVFSADYDSKGSILLSRNYNKQGEVVIENSYHSNGQVKERKEKVKENGITVTEITKFDVNGRKLS